LPLEGLAPGMVMVMGQAQSSTMLDYNFMLNYGLEKASLPPVISINENLDGLNATWNANGLTFSLQGDVLDPDGEDVTLSLRLCGYTTNDFLRVGSGWEIDVNIVTCAAQNPPVTSYDILLTATDESGSITTLSVYVPSQDSNDGSSDNSDNVQVIEEEGLPAISMVATLSITLLGAAFASRTRRD